MRPERLSPISAPARLLALATFVAFMLAACSTDAPTSPRGDRFIAVLNGERISEAGRAVLWQRPGTPDSLSVLGFANGYIVEIKVEYHGPGRYELPPRAIKIWILGGEPPHAPGEYRGSTTAAGELVLTKASGVGEAIVAEFSFDAHHVGGQARFGLAVTIRSGRIYTSLHYPPIAS